MIRIASARSRPIRAVRAGAFAAASTGLGVIAHRLGGGALPPLWLALLGAVGLFMLALAFTGTRRRLPVIAALVLTTQTMMHVGLTVITRPAMTSSNAMTGRHQSLLDMVLCRRPGHALSPGQLAAARSTLTSLHVTGQHAPPTAMSAQSMSVGGMLSTSMAWMLAAHLAAALVMAWWLARGERAVWRCAHQALETIRVITRGLPGAGALAAALVVGPTITPLAPRWLLLCAAGRAPPRLRLIDLMPATV